MIQEDLERVTSTAVSNTSDGASVAPASASSLSGVALVSPPAVAVDETVTIVLSAMAGADILDKKTATLKRQKSKSVRSLENYLRSKLGADRSYVSPLISAYRFIVVTVFITSYLSVFILSWIRAHF
jgi:hypothetical protein